MEERKTSVLHIANFEQFPIQIRVSKEGIDKTDALFYLLHY